MNTPDQAGTPSQELAQQIVARLVDEQLISVESARSLLPKLAAGKLRGEDWRLPIELDGHKDARQ